MFQFSHSNLERLGKRYESVWVAVESNCKVAVLISIVFALVNRDADEAYDGEVLPPRLGGGGAE